MTTASEKNIQEGLQAIIQALPDFREGTVVVNDWSVLDGSNLKAPFVIIIAADDFESRKDTSVAQNTWSVPVILYERFINWPTSLGRFRDLRQTLLDTFNANDDSRSANGLEAVDVRVIRNEGPISPLYDRNIPDNLKAQSLPQYLTQTFIFETEEF